MRKTKFMKIMYNNEKELIDLLITGQSEKEKQYHKKISEKNQKRERLPRGIYQEKRR